MKNGHHNFNGDHGPELVTYIYGEMDDRARASFESHLAGCDDCAAELASVSDARLGVIEWRRNDFDHLSTPAIILPASEPAFSIAPVSAGRSGIAALFESIFSLPVIARVGVGLATAAVVVGIIYYSGVFRPVSDELAENVNRPAVAGPNAAQPERREVVNTLPESDRNAAVSGNGPDTRAHDSSIRTAVRSKRSGSKVRPVSDNQPSKPDARVADRQVRTPPDTQVNSPRLNNFEESEDITLRLADLFEEVGAS